MSPPAISNPRLVLAKISEKVKKTVKKLTSKNKTGIKVYSGGRKKKNIVHIIQRQNVRINAAAKFFLTSRCLGLRMGRGMIQ